MTISFLQIIILGLIQGAAELLPVSSSAHVIVAEKLMGIDPATPEMTFLLVMLHTGTMFAVLVYFWRAWIAHYFSDRNQLRNVGIQAILATAITGVVGFGLKVAVEKVFLAGEGKGEIEQLFASLPLMSAALAAAGVFITISGLRSQKTGPGRDIDFASSVWIGMSQGLCLPFRGLSRSGTTISVGLLAKSGRRAAEEFSFLLAVILTPAAIVIEWHRLAKAHAATGVALNLVPLVLPGFIGLVASFLAGLLALKLLSGWLESGRWQYFGYYCFAAAAVVFALARLGY